MTHPTWRGVLASITALFVLLGVLTVSPAAHADQSFAIRWTGIGIYPRSTPEMLTSNRIGPALPDGARISIACETLGATVTSAVATSSIWEKTREGVYLPNAFVDTGVNGFTPGIPRCDQPASAKTPSWTQAQIAPVTGYVPQVAQEWARSNYKTFPLKYSPSNCTWFISHALWAGGVAKTNNWTDSSFAVWNLASKREVPGPTKAATTADYLKNELVNSKVGKLEQIDPGVASIPNAKIGDLIFWDWDPDGKADGAVDHVVMITGFVDGAPVVTGQSNNVLDQRWQYTSDQRLITSTKKVAYAYIMRIRH
jgi:hypothetical protein